MDYLFSLIFMAIGSYDVYLAITYFIEHHYGLGSLFSMAALWMICYMIKGIFKL